MKTVLRIASLFLVLLLISNCGYRNPNVYSGPHKSIYVIEWKNRTSELKLDSQIYRSLTKWFQKSGSISTVRQKAGADLILAGEIVSIELPSLSYGTDNVATEVKVRLRVRYILKEISTKKILLEVSDETWTEEYLVSSTSSVNTDNEETALETIIDDISKKIYQRTVAILPTL
ncbi:MAG: LptE family protein [Desulfobulbaceae bacterium]|nr:LptE family protein [Desulfobulbaceae bacterium]